MLKKLLSRLLFVECELLHVLSQLFELMIVLITLIVLRFFVRLEQISALRISLNFNPELLSPVIVHVVASCLALNTLQVHLLMLLPIFISRWSHQRQNHMASLL